MRCPRLTIRRLMVMVLMLAIVMGLTLPAVETYRSRFDEAHFHAYVKVIDGKSAAVHERKFPPFWPRYIRRLQGTKQGQGPVCYQFEGRLAEACLYSHPEIGPVRPPGLGFGETTEMKALLWPQVTKSQQAQLLKEP